MTHPTPDQDTTVSDELRIVASRLDEIADRLIHLVGQLQAITEKGTRADD